MDLDLGTQLDVLSDAGDHVSPHDPASRMSLPMVEPVEVMPGTSDASVHGLLNLTPPQLLDMLPPMVLDLDLCASMRRPSVSVDMRMQLLAKQDHVWADDEMWWQLQVIAATEPRDIAFLDPLLAHTWLSTGTADAIHV